MLLGQMACRQAPAPTGEVQSLKIAVRETGLYRLKASDLQRAGLSAAALEAGNLHLSQAGEEVPFHLEGKDLLFYGLRSDDRYTPDRVYILSVGEPGPRIALQAAAPDNTKRLATVQRTITLEQNLEYVSEAIEADPSIAPWFWQTFGFGQNDPLEFELEGVVDAPAHLQARFYGVSHNPSVEPDHHLQLTVNGAAPAEISWEGQTYYTATLTLSPGSLTSGANSIAIQSVTGEYLDISKLDYLRITYDAEPRASENYISFNSDAGNLFLEGFQEQPLLFDVTDAGAPLLLTDFVHEAGVAQVALRKQGAYVAAATAGFLQAHNIAPLLTSRLTETDRQADLLIITTRELAPALEPLVEAREAEGLTVALAPVEEIYDAFGHGSNSPESINRFIKHTYQEWQAPAPQYVLLVGDATTDYWGYLESQPEGRIAPPANIVPSFLVPVSFGGETISDARLADVEGDERPELAVGRWPVATIAEVRDLVQRTLDYERRAAPPGALFAVDGSSREFERVSENVINGSGLAPEQVHLLVGPAPAELAASWQEGHWLVAYAGHGSLQLWSQEAMLSPENVAELFSDGSAPILVQLTCLTGLFAHPEIPSLSERMLSDPGGPPLIVAATSLTLSVHQEPFAIRLLEALQDTQVERIGDALQIAKDSLEVERIGLREISDTFVLLGDPSAKIVRPSS